MPCRIPALPELPPAGPPGIAVSGVFVIAVNAPPAVSAYLLDIDLVWQWPAEPLSIESTMVKIDELRRRERIIFERLITDRARGLFDAT